MFRWNMDEHDTTENATMIKAVISQTMDIAMQHPELAGGTAGAAIGAAAGIEIGKLGAAGLAAGGTARAIPAAAVLAIPAAAGMGIGIAIAHVARKLLSEPNGCKHQETVEKALALWCRRTSKQTWSARGAA